MHHKEILTPEQIALLPIVKLFSDSFGLVGGTAIAFYLGHRESIDFDLFTFDEFSNPKIRRKISDVTKINTIIRDETGQYTFLINGVKFTFFQFPYKIDFVNSFEDIIKLPDLLTLASMKAFALGRRAKWKDYVDMYFILKSGYTIKDITAKSLEIFGHEFNEKIFRVQLSYFKDIDYTEEVIFREGFAIPDEEVKNELIKYSLAE